MRSLVLFLLYILLFSINLNHSAGFTTQHITSFIGILQSSDLRMFLFQLTFLKRFQQKVCFGLAIISIVGSRLKHVVLARVDLRVPHIELMLELILEERTHIVGNCMIHHTIVVNFIFSFFSKQIKTTSLVPLQLHYIRFVAHNV